MVPGKSVRVGIVGSGTMGSGIAEAFLLAGDQVLLFDINQEQLRSARERIFKGFAKLERQLPQGSMDTTTNWESFEETDFAVEAVSETLAVKRYVFSELDRYLLPPKVIATNTSSLSVGRIAQACANPERVIGMHFFNPVRHLRFIEVVVGETTNGETLRFVCEQARRLEREFVLAKDSPGFVANRILTPFFLEALRILNERQVSPLLIDGALRRLGQFPMGPFELADLIGLDVNGDIAKTLYMGLGRAKRFLLDDVVRDLIKKKHLGRKPGLGFYAYGAEEKTLNEAFSSLRKETQAQEQEEIFLEIMSPVINEAFLLLEEGVAAEEGIGKTMRLGCNWPKGPFEFFRDIGPAKIKEALDRLVETYPKRYPLSQTLVFRSERIS